MDKKKIGLFLRELRKDKNLSKEKMVDEISKKTSIYITVDAVGKWERGETFPDIDNVKDLAKFYSVSIDEIFNGEREKELNLEEKYIFSNENWYKKYQIKKGERNEILLVTQKEYIKIEKTFNSLLEKLVNNAITKMEEEELNYICEKFYTLKDNLNIEQVKFEIRKKYVCMKGASLEEKLWEANKYFTFKNQIRFETTVQGAVAEKDKEAVDLLTERIKIAPSFLKDVFLAFIQKNNFHNFYSKEDFLRVYGQEYDEEKLTKKIIKLLIENGACLNEDLLGKYYKQQTRKNILETIEKLYSKFKKPILISVGEMENRMYYLVQNTATNRKILGIKDEGLDESLLPVLEEKLYNGEREYIEEKEIWSGVLEKKLQNVEIEDIEEERYLGFIGIKPAEDENYKRVKNLINNIGKLSFNEYSKARNLKKTKALLKEIDFLSLKQIREKYFIVESE